MTTTPSTRVIGSWYSTSSPPSDPASTAERDEHGGEPGDEQRDAEQHAAARRGGPDERVARRWSRVGRTPVIPPR